MTIGIAQTPFAEPCCCLVHVTMSGPDAVQLHATGTAAPVHNPQLGLTTGPSALEPATANA